MAGIYGCGLIRRRKNRSPSRIPPPIGLLAYQDATETLKVSEGFSNLTSWSLPADRPHVRRILTAACDRGELPPDSCAREFPALWFSLIRLRAVNLRTVIVTDALTGDSVQAFAPAAATPCF